MFACNDLHVPEKIPGDLEFEKNSSDSGIPLESTYGLRVIKTGPVYRKKKYIFHL